MKYRYTTESGSVYIIDATAKTWQRVRGSQASVIRSEDGAVEPYLEITFQDRFGDGNCLVINVNGIRHVFSTTIISEEEIDE